MPTFGRYEELTGRSIRVTYDANDPNKFVREEATSEVELELLARDGRLGAGAVEVLLTKLLR
jgi:hypothetical protein